MYIYVKFKTSCVVILDYYIAYIYSFYIFQSFIFDQKPQEVAVKNISPHYLKYFGVSAQRRYSSNSTSTPVSQKSCSPAPSSGLRTPWGTQRRRSASSCTAERCFSSTKRSAGSRRQTRTLTSALDPWTQQMSVSWLGYSCCPSWSGLIPKDQIRLYRDDGLAVIELSRPEVERLKKKVVKLFF